MDTRFVDDIRARTHLINRVQPAGHGRLPTQFEVPASLGREPCGLT
jgi:hypothetical protein